MNFNSKFAAAFEIITVKAVISNLMLPPKIDMNFKFLKNEENVELFKTKKIK
jgi:hypothetical protein